ncbi:MAG: hypothetical protein NVSMB31_12070 [Vulcanimicrobiaceae bacterium]
MSRKLLTLGLFFALAACGGGGGGGSATSALPGVPVGKPVSGQNAAVTLTFTVPKAGQARQRSPQAIAPNTLSIDVIVNGGAAQTFNVTTTGGGTGGCVTGVSTTCTETVLAPLGADTFAITTYSANGGSAGTGVSLDAGSFSYTVLANTANAPTFTLNAVVSTSASTNTPGSLLYALSNASSNDVINLLASAGPSITVTSPITIAQNVTLAGPGAANLTITGAGTSQLFIISTGLLGVTIKGLTLAHGTAVGGGAIKNNSNLTLDQDTFSMNTSTGGTAGGAIYNGIGANLTVTNSQFTSNSGPQGGAIYVHASSGTVSITGTTFSSNTATTNGGALLIYSPTTLTNDVFQNNIAGDTSVNNGQGGAIFYAASLPLQTISGSTFTANQALSCNTCSNYGYGGAVYADTATPLTLSNDTYGTSGVSATGNAAIGQYGGYGGAVYVKGAATITGGAYYYNSASSSTTGSTSYGGAIWVNGNLTDSGGTVFDHNNAGGTLPVNSGGAGGAINANAGSVSGATFTNNSALGSGTGAGNGGAICSGASLQIGDSVIGTAGNGNTASTAGAGYYGMGAASDQIYRTTIDSNTITGASPTSGAGIYIASGTSLSLSQDTISNNQLIGSASATGAGLMNNGTTTVQNTTFFGNSSSNLGGNIYNFSSLTLILSTVVRGTGGSNSGNVYNVTSSGNMATNGTIFAYGNGSTANSGINNNSVITSNDYNDMVGAITGSFTPAAHDQTLDPNLSPTLAVNGTTYGPLTDAPLAPPPTFLDTTLPYGAGCAGSGGVTTDERGMFRAIGTSHPSYCTIGAYADP